MLLSPSKIPTTALLITIFFLKLIFKSIYNAININNTGKNWLVRTVFNNNGNKNIEYKILLIFALLSLHILLLIKYTNTTVKDVIIQFTNFKKKTLLIIFKRTAWSSSFKLICNIILLGGLKNEYSRCNYSTIISIWSGFRF